MSRLFAISDKKLDQIQYIFRCTSLTRLFILIILCLSINYDVEGQHNKIERIEKSLKSTYGLEKLIGLNRLTEYYHDQDEKKPSKYAKQAVKLGEDVFVITNTNVEYEDRVHLMQAYFQLGEIKYENEKYLNAQDDLFASRIISLELGDTTYLSKTNFYLDKIQGMLDRGEVKENIFSKTFGEIKLGKAFDNTSRDLLIKNELKLAEASEKKGDMHNAISHYEKASNLLRNKGDAKKVSEVQFKMAILLDSIELHNEAKQVLDDAIVELEENIKEGEQKNLDISKKKEEDFPGTDGGIMTLEDSIKKEQQSLKQLSEQYAEQNDFARSRIYYELYQKLSDKYTEDSIQSIALSSQLESELILLKQQKEIADLKVDSAIKARQQQEKVRNNLIFLAAIILIGTIIILSLYTSKRRQHNKLSDAYKDLDQTKNKLEGAEKRIVTLLKQQLSGDIASELIDKGSTNIVERRFVCIMFLDIRDFTPMAEKISPEELITYQNKVFGFMIDIVQKYNGNINQLLGDGFMATFGAPISKGNDCQNAYLASLEILDELDLRNKSGEIPNTNIGIGLHAGNVVTGNVGNDVRKQYSVTGNPVILACRIEQLNKKYDSKFLISEEVCQKLEDHIKPDDSPINVNVKGRNNPLKIIRVA